jgi:hypothetical protein
MRINKENKDNNRPIEIKRVEEVKKTSEVVIVKEV